MVWCKQLVKVGFLPIILNKILIEEHKIQELKRVFFFSFFKNNIDFFKFPNFVILIVDIEF